MRTLFITGGSGFVGRSVLRLLRGDPAEPVVCLTRDPAALSAAVPPPPGWTYAAKFADQRYYHYARAKVEAESLARSSRISYLIVRPTMVLGEGSAGPAVHIPARPVQALLVAAELLLGRRLPLRAGQLSSFLNDGTADPDPLTHSLLSELSGVDSMLSGPVTHA